MFRISRVAAVSLGQLFFAYGLWANLYPQGMLNMMTQQQQTKLGKELFIRHCAGCHGIDARGRGEASQFLHPKPRNLLEGTFKFKSTGMGALPSKSDLLAVLEKGIIGSSMPSFKLLPSLQREAIVQYVMTLRPEWEKQNLPQLAVPFPPDSLKKRETFLASALKGSKSYTEFCSSCHGDKGLGDGPASEGTFDSENEPLKPANLRNKHLKSGSGARDIFKIITTGVDGTPMPPFSDALTEEQKWELVAYVLFLRGQEEGLYPSDFNLEKVEKK